MSIRLRQSDLFRSLALMEARLWPYLITLTIGRLFNAIFINAVLAYVLKDMVDGAVRGDVTLMRRGLFVAAFAFFIGIPLITLFYYIAERYVKDTMTALRARLFAHVSRLPIRYFEQQHSGSTLSTLTNDLATMEGVYHGIRDLSRLLAFGLVALTAIFMLDHNFGWLVLFIGLMTTAINTIFVKPLRRLSDVIQQQWSKLTERTIDLVQGMVETKIFHIESLIHNAYRQTNEALATAQVKQGQWEGIFNTALFVIEKIRTVGLFAGGLYALLVGYPIEIGTLAAILTLQGIADLSFSGIGQAVSNLQRSLAGAGRVLALLDQVREPDIDCQITNASDQATVVTSAADKPAIVMDHVTFGYAEEGSNGAPTIHELCLSAWPGRRIALVGPSGGGKSTIFKLLLGLYSVKAGEIRINGTPISDHMLPALRQQIAYVPQLVYLFAGTIEENIRYGKPQATQAEIIAAAQAANAHEFIMAQPLGYQTLVGERGSQLSGGQRQRIAIARAFLKAAPILLLDEATAALDSASERLVHTALDQLMTGRTTLVIAHRLSTIEHADLICVIDQGRIIEQGNHFELLQKGGYYHRLYEIQFKHDISRADDSTAFQTSTN